MPGGEDVAVDLPDNIIEELDIPPPANAEPTMEEIEQYAEYMGLNLEDEEDRQYIWLLREGLKAPMPPDWKKYRMMDSDDSFYFNGRTGESVWDHPCDIYYKKLLEEEKVKTKKKKEEEKKKKAAQKKTASTSHGLTRTDPGKTSLNSRSPLGLTPLKTLSGDPSTSTSGVGTNKAISPISTGGASKKGLNVKIASGKSSGGVDALFSSVQDTEDTGDLELDLNSDSGEATPLSARVFDNTGSNSARGLSSSKRPQSSPGLAGTGRLGVDDYKEEMERLQLKKESKDRLEKEKQRLLQLELEEKNDFIDEREEVFKTWKKSKQAEYEKKKDAVEREHKAALEEQLERQRRAKKELEEAIHNVEADRDDAVARVDNDSSKKLQAAKEKAARDMEQLERKLKVERETLQKQVEELEKLSAAKSAEVDEASRRQSEQLEKAKGQSLKEIEAKYDRLFADAKQSHDERMSELSKKEREARTTLDNVRSERDECERSFLLKKTELLQEESNLKSRMGEKKAELEEELKALRGQIKEAEATLASFNSKENDERASSESLRESLRREKDLRNRMEEMKRDLSDQLDREKTRSSKLESRVRDYEDNTLVQSEHDKRRIRDLVQEVEDAERRHDAVLKAERARSSALEVELVEKEDEMRKKTKQLSSEVTSFQEEVERLKRERLQKLSATQEHREADLQAEIDSLNRTLSQLRSQSRVDKSRIEELEGKVFEEGSTRARLKARLEKLESEVDELNAELTKKNAKLKTLEKREKDTLKEAKEQEREMKEAVEKQRELEAKLEKREIGEAIIRDLNIDDSIDDITELSEHGGPVHSHAASGYRPSSPPVAGLGVGSGAGLHSMYQRTGPIASTLPSFGGGVAGEESLPMQEDIIRQVRSHIKRQKALLFTIQKKLKEEVQQWKTEMKSAKKEHESRLSRSESFEEKETLNEEFRERLAETLLPVKMKIDQQISALNGDIRKVREMKQWVEKREAMLAMNRVGLVHPMYGAPPPAPHQQPQQVPVGVPLSSAHHPHGQYSFYGAPQAATMGSGGGVGDTSFYSTGAPVYHQTPAANHPSAYGGGYSFHRYGQQIHGSGAGYEGYPHAGPGPFAARDPYVNSSVNYGASVGGGPSLPMEDAAARIESMRNMLLKWCNTRQDFSSSIQNHIGNLQSFSERLNRATDSIRSPSKRVSKSPARQHSPILHDTSDSKVASRDGGLSSQEVVLRIKVDK